MFLDDAFHDGKAQSAAAAIARAGGVGAIETLEDVWQILWRDADARIAHADKRVSIFRGQ